MKYYYGDRGSGKTTKLLKEAAKAVVDEYDVVFVSIHNEHIANLKEMSLRMFGASITNKITFVSASKCKEAVAGLPEKNLKVFIDETQYVLYQLLFGVGRNFDVTMSLDTDDDYSTKLERKK